MRTAVLALLLCAWAALPALAQDRNGHESDVLCGAEWVTFQLPGIPEEKRGDFGAAVANTERGTVLTIRKTDVRNAVYHAETKNGEVVFRLETVSTERPMVIYSGLVTEAVYRDVVLCLD